ncbi:DUF6807 domain-containing protein [Deminuibacter soli]|uniref:Methane oxygenase PmoA n=1 Tax=Deminuibacter soli TaxID=2291815 RepID=A0A3E1ND17_9BACT|nr:PmoA family protein [Deminuibacter soli]RFM25731.1 hypothetical protein DXN05_23775 [Deminuibacter soli]
MKSIYLLHGYLLCFLVSDSAFFRNNDNARIQVTDNPATHEVQVTIDNQPFTSFLYSDSLAKPILFPIYAPGEIVVTRGFPLAPRTGESPDHPHHEGLWLNYESVNGLDFWNNSYAIPPEKRNSYGAIKRTAVTNTSSGTTGELSYTANWVNMQQQVLLTENTRFVFSTKEDARIIDRITTLTAQQQEVHFADTKDGLLGLRVTRELELPSNKPQQFTDAHGNITTVQPGPAVANGDYLTSEGKKGDDAWSSRGKWCLLYGKKNNTPLSIAIIDHPQNPGYPTYWHARGYGLFAANPLGQKVFSKGKDSLELSVQPGKAVTFRYRIVVAAGKNYLSQQRLNEWSDAFAKEF